MAWIGRLAASAGEVLESLVRAAARVLAWTLGLSLLGFVYFVIGVLVIDWLDGRNMSEAAYAHSLGRRTEALLIPFALATAAAIGVWQTFLWGQKSVVQYSGQRKLGLWVVLVATTVIFVAVPLYAFAWESWTLQWSYWNTRPALAPYSTRDPVGILRGLLIPGYPLLICKILRL